MKPEQWRDRDNVNAIQKADGCMPQQLTLPIYKNNRSIQSLQSGN